MNATRSFSISRRASPADETAAGAVSATPSPRLVPPPPLLRRRRPRASAEAVVLGAPEITGGVDQETVPATGALHGVVALGERDRLVEEAAARGRKDEEVRGRVHAVAERPVERAVVVDVDVVVDDHDDLPEVLGGGAAPA